MNHPEPITRPEGNWVAVKQQMRAMALQEMREESKLYETVKNKAKGTYVQSG